ncbi:MAG: flavodoxin family protein [Deltaproteobacteria bacterium]|nr:flavodoxin family protein [Deltaproteobacteria bacterium]
MKIVYVSGSPRKDSNTDLLLKFMISFTGGDLVKLSDYRVEPCLACWSCLKAGACAIKDDMSQILIPSLLKADAIVLGSPVFFNNVSAQLKAFIDRTWSIKGRLRNKIGGAVVVGRRDGAESAITAIHAFFLKHEIIPANRGVHGTAFARGEITEDGEAMESARKLCERLMELETILVPQ